MSGLAARIACGPGRRNWGEGHIVVVVKQVPDTAVERTLRDADRASVEGLINELDEYAVEEGLKIAGAKREAGNQAEVTFVTMGPDKASRPSFRTVSASSFIGRRPPDPLDVLDRGFETVLGGYFTCLEEVLRDADRCFGGALGRPDLKEVELLALDGELGVEDVAAGLPEFRKERPRLLEGASAARSRPVRSCRGEKGSMDALSPRKILRAA
jgi:hypothetical protein